MGAGGGRFGSVNVLLVAGWLDQCWKQFSCVLRTATSTSSTFRAPLLGSVWLAVTTQGGRGRASQPATASQPASTPNQTTSTQPACPPSPLAHSCQPDNTLRVASSTQSYPARARFYVYRARPGFLPPYATELLKSCDKFFKLLAASLHRSIASSSIAYV